MQQPILCAHNLSYRHHAKLILNQCNLSLSSNEVVALIGSNGAGKTTLLHLLAGLKKPAQGQVDRSHSLTGQWLGLLPDTPPLYPSMRVAEFLRYCAYIRGLEAIEQAVKQVIDTCQLQAVAHERCRALSHGYRQRVGLAQAIIHQPPVIFLDEPTNGLDYTQKQALRPLLTNLGQHASVLMISHDYEEVIATADRIYLLQAGKAHEITLPPATGLWWLRLDKAQSLHSLLDIAMDEGEYIAIDSNRYSRGEVYRLLQENAISVSVASTYPVAALQARIDNVD